MFGCVPAIVGTPAERITRLKTIIEMEQRSNNMKKKDYCAPQTTKVDVELENGFMAASKEKVVQDDENTSVSIEEQTDGGSFELDTWE